MFLTNVETEGEVGSVNMFNPTVASHCLFQCETSDVVLSVAWH